jgi:phage gpG-like protein
MGFKVRIRGIDTYIRDLAKVDQRTYYAARDGTIKAADYLLKIIRRKIGVYQSTGGDPGGQGRWKKLKWETIKRKSIKYGVGDKPLLASGDLKDSFSVIEGGKGRLSASVGSDSPYLIHHVYGAPGAKVPMRDPIRITAIEERDTCHEIIEDEVTKVIDELWGN